MSSALQRCIDRVSACAAEDIVTDLVGEKLGHGRDRFVFACLADPDALVIKVEKTDEFANVEEFKLWQVAKSYDSSIYLAPSFALSACGTFLIQARTTPLTDEQFKVLKKTKLPWWFTDARRDNWGVYEGRFVCHDYSRTLFNRDLGCYKQFIKLRKLKWY